MSIKILLADDSITIQKVVGIIFGGDEYSLTVVDNGKAAVEKARELNPDVLLIDALMPGMSGYEVCEAVRATPAISSTPILLLTGSFEPFDETKAKNCGADDFLAKPFESQQIVTKVKELFDLSSSRTAAPVVALSHEAETFVASPDTESTDEPGADNDIWGAFTAPEEPASAAATASTTPDPAESFDIFNMVGEEPEAPMTPSAEEISSLNKGTGSQWIPVEEETFEYEEESSEELKAPAFRVPESTVEENMFGDTDFGAAAVSPPAPKAEAVPVIEPLPEYVPVVPVVPAPPAALTEEQLREALASASKEVIERIVWEVVPDLAEVLIKEAIRQIKEGQ